MTRTEFYYAEHLIGMMCLRVLLIRIIKTHCDRSDSPHKFELKWPSANRLDKSPRWTYYGTDYHVYRVIWYISMR